MISIKWINYIGIATEGDRETERDREREILFQDTRSDSSIFYMPAFLAA